MNPSVKWTLKGKDVRKSNQKHGADALESLKNAETTALVCMEGVHAALSTAATAALGPPPLQLDY